MALVGLIGGVSPEATKIYYDLLNAQSRKRHGGQHSARVLYAMLDYGIMYGHYKDENWAAFTKEVVIAAEQLKSAGVSALAITSGTTHVAADAVSKATGLHLIHMLDSLSAAMQSKSVKRPLLLGTPWVMNGPFFNAELLKRYDGDPIIARDKDRETVGHVIFNELVNGIVEPLSKARMIDLVNSYQEQGADGVILGCTELCMILEEGDCNVPVFSTTHIHANAIDAFMNSVEN